MAKGVKMHISGARMGLHWDKHAFQDNVTLGPLKVVGFPFGGIPQIRAAPARYLRKTLRGPEVVLE